MELEVAGKGKQWVIIRMDMMFEVQVQNRWERELWQNSMNLSGDEEKARWGQGLELDQSRREKTSSATETGQKTIRGTSQG